MLGALVGCASGSSIVTGKTRTAIQVEAVTIYLEQPPPSYEQVALIEAATKGAAYQQDIDRMVAELKRRAAKMGANGLLLYSQRPSVEHKKARERGPTTVISCLSGLYYLCASSTMRSREGYWVSIVRGVAIYVP